MNKKLSTQKKPPLEISLRAADQFGMALKRLRKLRGWTQTELSRRSRIRQAHLSMIESGKLNPEATTIFVLCSALDLEVVIRPRGSNG